MDGWIEGRGGKESIFLFLLSLSDVRCRRGEYPSYIWAGVESPFHPPFLPSLPPSFPPSPCRPGNVLYKARGR